MTSEKSKLAKSNLKTSLYFAGGITFGTVAVGAAVSIPVYLEIKKSLAAAIEKFSNLSKYLSQLSQKLGLPSNAAFEQELANGYVAVYTPGGGTKVFKTVDGKKVLVMNTNSDGSVSTAAAFEGVEALTMMTAMDSAKEAYNNETEAMESILEEYGAAVDDASYLTEAATTDKPVAILVLRDELAVFNVASPSQVQIDEAIVKTNIKLQGQNSSGGIATRNALSPDHVDQIMVPEALDMIVAQKHLAELDAAKASGSITKAQQAELDRQAAEHLTALATAKVQLESIKANQATAAAHAAASVAIKTQEAVVSKIESNPSDNGAFITANTSTIQTWLPLLGATFGNVAGNGLSEHAYSKILREPIRSQLGKHGLEESKFDNLKNALLDIIGLGSEKNNWLTTTKLATKKVLTVTPMLNTFASTSAKSRLVLLDIKVNNISARKIEDYILIGRPSATLAYDFEKFVVVGEDYGPYKNQVQKFMNFVSTLNQLALIAWSSELKELNSSALGQLNKILDELGTQSPNLNAIKLTPNNDTYAKLLELMRSSAKAENHGVFAELAKKIYESNFVLNGQDVTFMPEDFAELVTGIIAKDNFVAAVGQTLDEIYNSIEHQTIMQWMLEHFEALDKNLANVKVDFEHNWASLDYLGLINLAKAQTNVDLLFNHSIKQNLDDAKAMGGIVDVLVSFKDEFMALLRQNPIDIKPYLSHMSYIKSMALADGLINKLKPLLIEPSYVNGFDALAALGAKNSNLVNADAEPCSNFDAIKSYLVNEFGQASAQIKNNVDLEPYLKQYSFVYSLGLSPTAFDQVKPLLTDQALMATWNAIIALGNDATWKVQDSKGTIGSALDAIKKYFSDETAAIVNQISQNTDIMTIKESIRYTFKGVDISDPETQARITAAKDVATKLDSLSGLAEDEKISIQDSVEKVITSNETKGLTTTEFAEIMKYTETVFKLFPKRADAVKQLNKVLAPVQLGAVGHNLVQNIATLNKWVEEIEKKLASGQAITLEMIKEYAWSQGIVTTSYTNGNPKVDIAGKQATGGSTLVISGAQLVPAADLGTAEAKTMLIGSYMWGLWALEHDGQFTKMSPVSINDDTVSLSQPSSSGWASSPFYLDGVMYALPLRTADRDIRTYDVKTGQESIIKIQGGAGDVEIRTSVVVAINGNKFIYGLSANSFIDEFAVSGDTATVTHDTFLPELSGWTPTWTGGTFKVGNENYVTMPVKNADKCGLAIWHVKQDGHLEFANLAQFSDQLGTAIAKSNTDATWSNAMATGETANGKILMFMLLADGQLVNIWIETPSGANNDKFVIDNAQTGIIINAAKHLPQNASSNPWRGMTYNQLTHEVNIFGLNGAVYVPDQSRNIAEIYETLLT